jgi:acyl carrier protein
VRAVTRDSILNDLRGLLANFNGREYSGDIEPDTMLFADLGLVSIDVVILGETLERIYGRPFPFGGFLAELGREGLRDLPLGRLVAFLDDQLTARTSEGQQCP